MTNINGEVTDIKSKFSSMKNSKVSKKSKRDLMSNYKDQSSSNQLINIEKQPNISNGGKVKTSFSKVRGKLIEAIQKLDKDKLIEV